MLAKLVDAVIDPRRMGLAVTAVEEELIPAFLAHDGALQGYWMADERSGHVLVVTTWSDLASLRGAAAADGAARATVGDRIGLSLRSVHTLPVLASSQETGRPSGRTDPGWIRVTWVEGVARTVRDQLPRLHEATAADQSGSAGFRGSYWLGDEDSAEGCAISLWDDETDLSAGAGASRRRRRRLARAMGFRVRSVRDYRAVGVAPSWTPADHVPEVAAV